MTPNDFDKFSEVVVAFAELKGRQLSPPAIELYWRAMHDWTLVDFRQAAEHLLRSCEFMPTPKNFEDLRKAGEPTAAEAWTTALTSCVCWRRPDDLPTGRIARAAAAVGGFRAIAMADEEHALPHIQRRFLDAYNEFMDVDPVREALPQIAAPANPVARIAHQAPTHIAGALAHLEPADERPQPVRSAPALPAAPKPTVIVSARDKITKLVALGMSDEDIAKVARESIDLVREVRAEQECPA